MALDSVSTSGSTLASLLATLAMTPNDADGLILGSIQSRTKHTLQDDTEATSADAHDAFVTALPCMAGSLTFYSPSGTVDEDRLREVVQRFGEGVLGFFVYRADTALAPSMREQVLAPAVLASLRGIQQLPPVSPLLFGIMSSGRQHNGASGSFQYRFYQNSAPDQSLQPVRLTVRNVGSSPAHRSFTAAAPLAGLPAAPCPVDLRHQSRASDEGGGGTGSSSTGSSRPAAALAAGGTGGSDDGGLREASLRAVSGIQDQVSGIEELYWRLLREVEILEPDVSSKLAAVTAARTRMAELQQSLSW